MQLLVTCGQLIGSDIGGCRPFCEPGLTCRWAPGFGQRVSRASDGMGGWGGSAPIIFFNHRRSNIEELKFDSIYLTNFHFWLEKKTERHD